MPGQVRHSLPFSIVEFYLNKDEDIFLSVPPEKLGRVIRDGKGPPGMEGLFFFPITDPIGLRTNTPLLCDALRQADLEDMWKRLTDSAKFPDLPAVFPKPAVAEAWASACAEDDLRRKFADMSGVLRGLIASHPSTDRLSDQLKEVLDRYVEETPILRAHDLEFNTDYGDYSIVGQQGCGDLTMNQWNVAFLNRQIDEGRPWLLYADGEPIARRRYTCLIKRQRDGDQRTSMTIELVRFIPNPRDSHHMVEVWNGSDWKAQGDDIEFAVSNRQVIRDGHVVDLSTITDRFSDLRCLFQLANLNSKDDLSTASYTDPGRGKRVLFASPTDDDVWLGEAELMADKNLQRAAMKGPIFLNLLAHGLGAEPRLASAALRKIGYEEVRNDTISLRRGQFRLTEEDNRIVEVFLRRNTYNWTMIGLTKERDRILALACEGDPKRLVGLTVEEAAEKLQSAGAHDALLIVAGQDVFQFADLGPGAGLPYSTVTMADGSDLDITVRPRRTRIRCAFIFAKPTTQGNAERST